MFTLEKSLVAGEKLAVMLAMMIAFLVVAVMVPTRYFNLPLPDLSELAITAIAVLTFLCIGLLVRTGGHIAIEVAALASSRRLKFILRQVANVGILLFVATFGVQAFKMLESAISGGEVTIALNIPLTVPFGALIIGLIFAAFHTVMNFARDVMVLRTPGADFEVEDDGVVPE
jgi:TRAP-type C4-dicarboxylate transport system permease small subunit